MRWIFGLLCTAFVFGCGGDDDGGTGPDPDPDNRAPQVFIEAQSPFVAFVAGESISLRAVGTDLDGDPLSYRWEIVSGSAPGSLSASSGSEVDWTAGALPGDVTIQVVANDGEDDSIHPDTISLLTATEISDGELVQNETWAASESPIVVNDDVHVPVGVVLTIESGVSLYFRPILRPGDVVEPRSFVVNGTLAVSGNPKRAEDIRMLGGRSDASVGDDKQWNGILLESDQAMTLSGLQISDAVDGLTNQGTGPLSLSNAAIRDCINGLILVDPDGTGPGQGIVSNTTLRGVEVTNNLVNGILLNSSWLDMEDCTVSSNGAMGVLATASTDFTSADIRGCLLSNNVSASLGYNNLFAAFNFRVSGCNIIAHPDENVAMDWGSCPLGGAFEIVGNYWGVNAGDDVQAIKDVMSGHSGCGYDFDSWIPDVDWFNTPIQMN